MLLYGLLAGFPIVLSPFLVHCGSPEVDDMSVLVRPYGSVIMSVQWADDELNDSPVTPCIL